jgi:hypothetical protein
VLRARRDRGDGGVTPPARRPPVPVAVLTEPHPVLAPLGGPGSDLASLASAYAADGWRVDAALMETIASAGTRADLVERVADALYRRWVDALARRFRASYEAAGALKIAAPSLTIGLGGQLRPARAVLLVNRDIADREPQLGDANYCKNLSRYCGDTAGTRCRQFFVSWRGGLFSLRRRLGGWRCGLGLVAPRHPGPAVLVHGSLSSIFGKVG